MGLYVNYSLSVFRGFWALVFEGRFLGFGPWFLDVGTNVRSAIVLRRTMQMVCLFLLQGCK